MNILSLTSLGPGIMTTAFSRTVRVYAVALPLFLVPLSATAGPGETYELSASQAELLRQALAARMLDPESTILRDVTAAQDDKPATADERLIWVCGNVSARNTFGGYAPPAPFLSGLIIKKGSPDQAIVVMLAGPTHAERNAVTVTCAKRITPR